MTIETSQYRGYRVSVRIWVGSRDFGGLEYRFLGLSGQPTDSPWDSDIAFFSSEQAARDFAQAHGHPSWNITGVDR